MSTTVAERRWVVLVGGGALGEWSGGALYSLGQAGLLNGLSGIVGTSVGGLNACALAVGLSTGTGVDLLRDLWAGITRDEDVYAPSIPGIQRSPWLNVFSVIGVARRFLWGPGAVDRKALEDLTQKAFGDWTTDMVKEKAGITLLVRAYDYKVGQARTLDGSLRDMALATSAIEGAFPSWQGYGDGGAVDNAPIDIALAMGATQVIVVYCAPDDPKPSGDAVTIGPVGAQTHTTGLSNVLSVAQNITRANEALVAAQAQAAKERGVDIVECYPPSDTGNFLDFTKRGLWDRGVRESALAIQAARNLGW